MNTGSFVTPASVRWCQDSTRVLVIDESANLAVSLAGLDAAVWKWFSLSYTYRDVLSFTQVFLKLSREDTEHRLNQIITQWVELGFLAPGVEK